MRRAYPAGSQEVLGLCLSAAMPSSVASFFYLNHQQHHHLASTVDDDTPTVLSACGGRRKRVGGVARGARVKQLGLWAERRLAVGRPAERGTLGMILLHVGRAGE